MLRDFVAAIQQSGNKKIFSVGVAQYYARTLIWRNYPNIVTSLFLGQRQGLPNLRLWRFRNFRRWTTLRRIRIVGRSTTRDSLQTRRAAATAPGNVAEIEDWSIETVHRQRVGIAVGNRAGGIDGLHAQNVA